MIFRITQEALNNISKHSRSDRAHLALRNSKGTLRLVVQDYGQGFEVKKALAKTGSNRGLGLAIMRERVEWSGGSFSVESRFDQGTLVQAHWPDRGARGRDRRPVKRFRGGKKKVRNEGVSGISNIQQGISTD